MNDVFVTTADWRTGKALRDIRQRVFIDEQQVPEDLEWDALDETATHFLLYRAEQPVGTGRVGQHGDRPRGQGLDREVRPVRPRPRQPRVEVAGPDPSGAQGDTGDLDRLRLPATPGGPGAGVRGQLAQRRTRRVGGAGVRVAAHGRTTLGTGAAGHHSTAHHSTGRSEGLVLVGGTA